MWSRLNWNSSVFTFSYTCFVELDSSWFKTFCVSFKLQLHLVYGDWITSLPCLFILWFHESWQMFLLMGNGATSYFGWSLVWAQWQWDGRAWKLGFYPYARHVWFPSTLNQQLDPNPHKSISWSCFASIARDCCMVIAECIWLRVWNNNLDLIFQDRSRGSISNLWLSILYIYLFGLTDRQI